MVLTVLTILAGLAAAAVGVPCAVFAAEVLLALLPARRWGGGAAAPVVAVLIPAHDEQGGIGRVVEALVGEGTGRVVVVADNCTDGTAAAARAAGAEVFERHDPDRRGKGYALAFGLERLADAPPQVVVVIDADCEPEPGAVAAIAARAHATGRPVQAEYLMRPPEVASTGDRVSALAFVFKNLIRPRGLARIGAPCLLTGSGMAIPFHLLEPGRLATGDIVEDLRLGVELARAGHPPMACPGVRVWSRLPGADAGRRSQRTRWEHGHLASIARFAPGLLWDGLRRGRPGLIALALELSVPPVSLLVMLAAGVCALAVGVAIAGGAWWPLWVASGALGCVGAGFALGWLRFGRAVLPLRGMLGVPAYALGKVPIYLRAITARQSAWIRTPRDSGAA